jgi:hypothetical protein
MGHAIISNMDSYDYFIVNTNVDITNTTVVSNGKTNFDRMVEIINIHSQPVLMSAITGSGPYTFKFAVEHKGFHKPSDIQNSFVLHGASFGFNTNTVVTQASGL